MDALAEFDTLHFDYGHPFSSFDPLFDYSFSPETADRQTEASPTGQTHYDMEDREMI